MRGTPCITSERISRSCCGVDSDVLSAAAVLDTLCDQLVPVWFSNGSKKMLMHPDDNVARLVISGDPAPAHLQDEVAAWREHYGVFASNG